MIQRDPIAGKKRFSFKFCQFITKVLYPKPKFKYIDADGFINRPFVFIVNHSGSRVPTRIENYFPVPMYMWGTYEMCEGLKAVRKYLIHTYYHQKKHVPLFFARIIGTLFAPFANGFYNGTRLIPTYTDGRLIQTFKETDRLVAEGNSLVVYPEDSSEGYKDQIEYIFNGFLAFCQMQIRKGNDMPVYVAYFQRKKRRFVIDKPHLYSELLKEYGNHDTISKELRHKMNSLMNYKG